MGGTGSGPRRTRPTVRDRPAVDARDLRRWWLFGRAEAVGGVLTWSRAGSPVASVRYRLTPGPEAELWLGWVAHPAVAEASVVVGLAATPCPFGGERWWLLCPQCDRRARAVYLHNGSFACRVCHRLTYPRQGRGPPSRSPCGG